MKKHLLITSILMLNIVFSFAQTTIYPTDDITTNTGSSGMAPTSEQLWIANWSAMQNYQQTCLKFDLSEYAEQNITSATLNLNQYFHAPDGTPTPATIYLITEDWDETSPLNTNLSHSDTPSVEVEFTETLGWYNIDVSELVNAMVQDGAQLYGLVIIADSGTKFAQFYSKDASDEANHPYLEIDFEQSISNNAVSEFSLYPNPITDHGTIILNMNKTQNVHIFLSDVLGKNICEVANHEFYTGSHSIDFNLNHVHEGIYLVNIISENETITKKIIKK